MKKIIFLITALLNTIFVSGQIDVTITTNKLPLYTSDGDTISLCRDSMIIFKAKALLSGSEVQNALYTWTFDDGNSKEGTDLDSVTHQYSTGGGYRVRLEVTDATSNTGYDIAPVRVAHLPRFTESNNGLPEDQNGICKGSSSTLTGFAYPYLWKDAPEYFVENDVPLKFNNNQDYNFSFYFDEFKKTEVFADDDISSVCMTLEHEASSGVRIELVCPNGNSIILKDIDTGNDFVMGKPLPSNTEQNGEGYKYCWTSSSSNGIMNDFAGDTLPAGNYLPEQAFSNLAGCPLNGNWSIRITDNTDGAAEKDGYVYSQEIIFAESALPALWTFQDSLKSSDALWLGSGNPVTQTQNLPVGGVKGIAVASPNTYGNNGYKFFITNNWGCPADTLVALPVEAATFTADPASGQAKLEVSLSSTTSWAKEHAWLLGVGSDKLTGDKVSYTYMEEGEYELVYIAKDDKGCIDTDTLEIPVTVEPSDLQVPNFFSPDGNGINDVLTLTVDGMKSFNFVIYTRWGRKVFEADNEEKAEAGWDGSVSSGAKASPGTYFFVFEGEGKDKKKWEEKGSIQLLR